METGERGVEFGIGKGGWREWRHRNVPHSSLFRRSLSDVGIAGLSTAGFSVPTDGDWLVC
jgi:hypothetical protein